MNGISLGTHQVPEQRQNAYQNHNSRQQSAQQVPNPVANQCHDKQQRQSLSHSTEEWLCSARHYDVLRCELPNAGLTIRTSRSVPVPLVTENFAEFDFELSLDAMSCSPQFHPELESLKLTADGVQLQSGPGRP